MTNRKSAPGAKIFRSKLFCWRGLLVLLALLVIAFFFLSRSRGQSEWEQYQKAVAAKGEHLDWAYFIPPAVTDSENFYAAPEMKQMFQRVSNGLGVTSTPTLRPSKYSWSLPIDRKWNELKGKEEFVTSPNTISYPVSVVLQWENENTELLQIFYTACQRPKARLLTDYSHSFVKDVPNFVNIRGAAQALGTLARAHIISGHPENALHDLDGIQRLIDALENGPTLVEAMVRVAVIDFMLIQCGSVLRKKRGMMNSCARCPDL